MAYTERTQTKVQEMSETVEVQWSSKGNTEMDFTVNDEGHEVQLRHN